MRRIKPTQAMIDAANSLNEGGLLVVYRDGTQIRAETVDGKDPYVWRDNQWRKMPISSHK